MVNELDRYLKNEKWSVIPESMVNVALRDLNSEVCSTRLRSVLSDALKFSLRLLAWETARPSETLKDRVNEDCSTSPEFVVHETLRFTEAPLAAEATNNNEP